MGSSILFKGLVLLTAALIFVPLAKRLYLGSILGYLVAGIIIGPYGLGIMGADNHELRQFAEFGVIMMLFLIGLELEPGSLRRLKRFILGAGLLQFSLTTLLTGGMFFLFGFSINASLAAGLGISMSSTALVLPTMKEKGIEHSPSGEAALSVLLTQDVAVIPVLALLPLLASQSSPSPLPGWLHTLSIFAAIGVVLISGKFVFVPFLRFIARSNLRELLTAGALFIVFSTALFMEVVGVSPALGTFLAGVVLAGSEFRHQLESDIEPFKGILLGLFFISIGAVINFASIAIMPGKIAGMMLAIFFLKSSVLFMSGMVGRLSLDQNLLFTVSLTQVGEFAFVLFTFMNRLLMIEKSWLDALLFITALSMMVTPISIFLAERFITRHMNLVEKGEREPKVEYQSNPVLIAGFGPFGSTIGRFLKANGVEATILDNDPDRVELLRKMGFKAFFGDATRLEVLRAAGIEEARVLIAAIGDWPINAELIAKARKVFPHLTILARVAHPVQAYELVEKGEENIYRETLDTSVRLGVDCLVKLGHRRYSAYRSAQKFLKYDEEAIKVLAGTRHDEDTHILAAKELIRIQEKLLMRDRAYNPTLNDHAWDSRTREGNE